MTDLWNSDGPGNISPVVAWPVGRVREPLWRDVLGDLLRGVRHQRGERLVEVAARAGVSAQYLSEIERGAKDPSSEIIAAVAGALNVGLVDLTAAVTERLSAARRPNAQMQSGRANLALAA